MEKLEFGNDTHTQKRKEHEQSNDIDEQIEALQTALCYADNPSAEHSQLLDFLEGTTTDGIDSICDDLQGALIKATSALEKISDNS